MTMSIEDRLVAAFQAVRTDVVEHPDLFARVNRSLADARARRRWRWRVVRCIAAFVAALAAVAAPFADLDNGRFTVDWWVIELLTNVVLVAIAICLGPFIKRFGRAYAADVFRANPRTGKSYLVLTDVAYYLIFTAFILFTITFEPPLDWQVTQANQWKHEVARIGGILLLMGLLHALNVVALPIIGRLLSLNKRLDDDGRTQPAPQPQSAPPLGPGTWIVRVELSGDPPAPPKE
ncbi:MAG: hypothetical protein ACR2HP_06250 [Ilumatobacteraceae bacterium]